MVDHMGRTDKERPLAGPTSSRVGRDGDPLPPGVTEDRRRSDRRAASDSATGLERRRGPGRRLSDFRKAAEEGQLTKEQFLFLMAIETFKRANGTPYPAWTDVLEVIRLLGYRKTQPSTLALPMAEDWSEPADTHAGVRPKRWEQRAAIDEERSREAA